MILSRKFDELAGASAPAFAADVVGEDAAAAGMSHSMKLSSPKKKPDSMSGSPGGTSSSGGGTSSHSGIATPVAKLLVPQLPCSVWVPVPSQNSRCQLPPWQ